MTLEWGMVMSALTDPGGGHSDMVISPRLLEMHLEGSS
jgi:hypothetical protein